MDKRIIEEKIFKITLEVMKKWEEKFSKINLYFDNPISQNNDSDSDYYSEIEVNIFHKSGEFVFFFAIIMFMQNKQVLDISKAEKHINEEIEFSYQYCSKKNFSFLEE